jgi:DNA-binding GntR family transcriptional regulator
MLHSPQQSLEDHKRICRALGRRNQEECLKAMEEHLEKEEHAFREVLRVKGKKRARRAGPPQVLGAREIR